MITQGAHFEKNGSFCKTRVNKFDLFKKVRHFITKESKQNGLTGFTENPTSNEFEELEDTERMRRGIKSSAFKRQL